VTVSEYVPGVDGLVTFPEVAPAGSDAAYVIVLVVPLTDSIIKEKV
jgi:hypothetical protein